MNIRSAVALSFVFSSWFGLAAQEQEQLLYEPVPLSMNELLHAQKLSAPTLSPSGKRIAATRYARGRHFLFIGDIEGSTVSFETHGLGDLALNWVEWATDDRLIFAATTHFDLNGFPISPARAVKQLNIPVRRLYSVNADGTVMKRFFDGDSEIERNFFIGEVTDFLLNDPEHVLVPARLKGDLDLFKINIFTGEYERLAIGGKGTVSWVTNRDGVPTFRIDLSPSGRLITIRERDQKSGGKVNWKTFKRVRKKAMSPGAIDDFVILGAGPDASTFFVSARPEGQDTVGLYLYDIEKKSFVQTLKTHPKVDLNLIFHNIETNEYLGTLYYEDRLVLDFEDRTLRAHMKALEKYFKSEVDMLPIAHNAKGDAWIINANGPRDRGSVHLYDLNTKQAIWLYDMYPEMNPDRLGRKSAIHYKARDGLDLMGYITYPPSWRKGQKRPLIVMPHGGPEVRDGYEYDSFAQFLATRGYLVFQPNFRGSSGFGKAFVDAGKQQWGRAMQRDLEDGYIHLVKEGIVESGKACIVGASYGGYAALMGLIQNGEDYRCGVAIAPVTHLIEQVKYDKKIARRFKEDDLYDYVISQLGDPRKHKSEMNAMSPALQADKIKDPLLLIHGAKDQIVPIDQSKRLIVGLDKAKVDYEYLELEMAGHQIQSNDYWKQVFTKVISFLDQHLPSEKDDFAKNASKSSEAGSDTN